MNTAAESNKEHKKAKSTDNKTEKEKERYNDSNTKTANTIECVEIVADTETVPVLK